MAARGKSEAGQKTMLDVLYPVAERSLAGVARRDRGGGGRGGGGDVPMKATGPRLLSRRLLERHMERARAPLLF